MGKCLKESEHEENKGCLCWRKNSSKSFHAQYLEEGEETPFYASNVTVECIKDALK